MISVNKRIGTAGATFVALALLATACSSDSKTADTTASTAAATTAVTGSTVTSSTVTGSTVAGTTPGTGSTDAGTTPGTGSTAISGVTKAGISDAECAANKAAGKITYLSSFDFAASASIIDVVVAKTNGYFDKMCLDVDLKSGFSTQNYPLVAANKAQFSSAGNYSEILNFSTNDASFVALADYGKAPIEALVVKDPSITDLAQLKGKTIGVKGDLPPSIVAMLATAGLQRGTDYKEVLLDGYDPVAQLATNIDALPVYKSNEPAALDKAGVKYGLFDPAKLGIPGSFGLIYTSKDYAAKHPTVVADFTRAALKGMADAIADPNAAVADSVKLIDAAGNSNFLTVEGETFRWNQEIVVVKASTPAGEPIGIIDPKVFDAEYAAYVKAGVWPKGAPTDGHDYDADLAKSLYDSSGTVIWPAS
jgi:ABC-type nitrate/sulfonate/bicarbonate transport system substrate-binding protein